MYSIHGLIRGKTLPLVYALLPNKNQQTYETLFRTVGQHIQNKPTFITIDFEKAAENAFATLFSPCEILGCFFHFKQSIWRNICVSLFLFYATYSRLFFTGIRIEERISWK
jgi:hypothetical protein